MIALFTSSVGTMVLSCYLHQPESHLQVCERSCTLSVWDTWTKLVQSWSNRSDQGCLGLIKITRESVDVNSWHLVKKLTEGGGNGIFCDLFSTGTRKCSCDSWAFGANNNLNIKKVWQGTAFAILATFSRVAQNHHVHGAPNDLLDV